MEIDQKIAEVKEYFTQKIVDCEFELVAVTEHIATISFGEGYLMEVWISNGLNNLAPYWHFDGSMALSIFPDTFSPEAKTVIKNVLTSYFERKLSRKALKEKRAQLRKLVQEVEELESRFNNKN